MTAFKWGILGTGNMANSMATALDLVEDAQVIAVGSRRLESSELFGQQRNIPRKYGSYLDLASDPDIDIVYISSPNSFHYDHVRLCFENGKHVLCEKPLMLNASQAKECIEIAKERKLFLMEAVWMRFIPATLKLKEMLDEGVLGAVQFTEIDFAFHSPYDESSRLYSRALGGGALLKETLPVVSRADSEQTRLFTSRLTSLEE